MIGISRHNPEYNATPWRSSRSFNTSRNTNDLPAAGSQAPIFTTQRDPENSWSRPPVNKEPIFTTQRDPENSGDRGWSIYPEPIFETQALYENGGITAHGSGLPPIDYSLPKDFTGFGENGSGRPPQQNDPYYMVKSPWMNAGQNYSSSHASSWYF